MFFSDGLAEPAPQNSGHLLLSGLQNRSPLIVLGYFLDAIILATYIPEYEVCIAAIPAATPLFFVPFALILLGLFHYRKKLLPMDKELIFEEPQTHWD